MAKRATSNGQLQPSRSALTVDDVVEEARTLRRFFAHFGSLDLRPVQFEPDESPLIRAFWESFGGWSPFFLSHFEPPELEHARRSMPAQLADYRRSGCKLTLADLPERFRFFDIDTQGIGMRLTDESSGTDPVLIELICDTSKLKRTRSTYLRTCAKDLLELAMQRMYRTKVSLASSSSFPVKGTPLLPRLAREVCQLHDGVWRLADEHSCVVLAHQSTDALIAWLETVELPPFSLDLLYGGERIKVVPGLETEFETLLEVTNEHGIVTRIGQLDGTKFLHEHTPPERFIAGDTVTISPRLCSRVPKTWRQVADERPRDISGEFCVPASRTPPPHDASLAGARDAAVKQLRSLVNECVPEHTSASELVLEDDTPKAVAEFWRLIGWSDWMASGIIRTHPSKERDHTALRRLLSRWMQDSKTRDRWHLDPGMDPVTLPCFPKRFRSIWIDESSPRYDGLAMTGGTWMILADESDNTDDPAIFEVPPGAPRRDYTPWRYTSYVARKLVAGLMERRKTAGWPPPEDAPRPFSPVLPDVCVIAPGVWCRTFESHTANTEPFCYEYLFASMGSLVSYALNLRSEDFARLNGPSHSTQLLSMSLSRAKATPARLEKMGLRAAQFKDRWGNEGCVAAGTLAGCPVILVNQRQLGLLLYAEVSDTDTLRQWAAAQGFGVRIR